MKYLLSFFCSLVLIFLLLFCSNSNEENDYLRIHIRANSNSSQDQTVKYEVKDAVVEALIPLVENCKSKQESFEVIQNNLSLIENIADNVLKQNGFSYTSNAQLKTENFPTRSYGDLVLESGVYDALILNLGSGTGDNWWCVVYPPLCFVNSDTKITGIKSRIVEIVENIFG